MGPCSKWSTKDCKDSSQEERAPVQVAECFRDGEAVTGCAQPGTVHQFLPLHPLWARLKHLAHLATSASHPPGPSLGFKVQRLEGWALCHQTACQQPSSLILVLHRAWEDGAGSARPDSAPVHCLPLPPHHHLHPGRIKSFQPFRRETPGTALKLSCWQEPVKSSHSSSFIDC